MTDSPKKRVRFGLFEADLVTGELWKGGVKLKLGGQPFNILAALLEHPGDLVTREELRLKIWPAETFVDFNHGLNAAVNKLRDTLGDCAEEPRYIETMPRRGYRFIGALTISESARPAEPLSVPPATEAAPPQTPLHETTLPDRPATQPIPVPASPRRRLPMYAWALVALIFLAGLYQFLHVQADLHASKLRAEKLEVENREARTTTVESRRDEVGLSAPAAGKPNVNRRSEAAAPTLASFRTAGVWQVDLAHPANDAALKLLAAGSGRNEGPQPSPDGKRLAFMSDRSGSLEIWISRQDGSSPQKLTNLGGCGSPQWSPDGKWIAFDSQAGPGIYIVSTEGPPITAPVASLDGISFVPRWSRDGKSIYFASEDTQVWKVAVGGGTPQQITRHGGFAASESYDGTTLYYAKHQNENPEIWEMPVAGGPEKLVSPLLRPSSWANWVVTETGILFLNFDVNQTSSIEFYDFATRGVRPLRAIPGSSFWLAASRDAKSAWYAEQAPPPNAIAGQEHE